MRPWRPDEQIARILDGSTPHPGASLTEPAVLARSLDELPATYILCLLAGAEPSDDVAKLLTSKHWRLVAPRSRPEVGVAE